jgi:hypothetical protein
MAEQTLFGSYSPELMKQTIEAERESNLLAQAKLTPQQITLLGAARSGQQLGGALGGVVNTLFGLPSVQDPRLQQAQLGQQAYQEALDLSGGDASSPAFFKRLSSSAAKLGVTTLAQQAAQQAAKLESEESLTAGRKAQAGEIEARIKKAEFSAAQEEKLRTELAALGPNATEKDIINVVTKYGSPDKILQVLQNAENVRLQKAQTAALRAQKASMLPAGLQKDELKDLETIDSFTAQSEALKPSILNLTPDSKGARKLELGPIKNSKYAAQNLSGNSTEESRAYEALKSAVDTAVNLQVSAEKGVQTDKDVLRFANALIAAFGRNDTQATLEALKRYNEAVEKAKGRVQTRIDSRRKSQGVESYFGTSGSPLGSMENPIILK